MKIDEEHFFWGTARGVLFINHDFNKVCHVPQLHGLQPTVHSTKTERPLDVQNTFRRNLNVSWTSIGRTDVFWTYQSSHSAQWEDWLNVSLSLPLNIRSLCGHSEKLGVLWQPAKHNLHRSSYWYIGCNLTKC